jgi:hypothetical protein
MDPALIESLDVLARPGWTDIAQAVAAGASVFVAVVGFVIVIRQVRQVRQALHSETQSRLYAEVNELLKVFFAYPELRPFFYEGRAMDRTHADYDRTWMLAGAFVAHFEHVVLQENNLPEQIRPHWVKYIQGMYATSPIIRQHMADNADWFSMRLHEIVRAVQSAEPAPLGHESQAPTRN